MATATGKRAGGCHDGNLMIALGKDTVATKSILCAATLGPCEASAIKNTYFSALLLPRCGMP